MKRKVTTQLILVILALLLAAVLGLKYGGEIWNKTYVPKVDVFPETKITGGTISRIEGGRIYFTFDTPAAGGSFKKIERMALITDATRIERYNLKEGKYMSVEKSDIRIDDSVQTHYTHWVDEGTVAANLIQLTSPADRLKVEDLIKSLQ